MTTPADLLTTLRETRDALRRFATIPADYAHPDCHCQDCDAARALAAADLAIAEAEREMTKEQSK